MSKHAQEPMLEMFIFETAQLLEQLEQIIISSEKSNSYSSHQINEIFRIMHTIKGSSAMMLYNNISTLSHSMEDLFYFIRENKTSSFDFSELTDLILKGADFIKTQLSKIEEDVDPNDDSGMIISEIKVFLENLKRENPSSGQSYQKAENAPQEKQQYYIVSENLEEVCAKRIFKAVIHFEEDCKMENVRAFTIVHNIRDMVSDVHYIPSNIIEDEGTEEIIRRDGFKLLFRTDYSIDTIREILMQTIFLKKLNLEELHNDEELKRIEKHPKIELNDSVLNIPKNTDREQDIETQSKAINQNIISVSISKLDTLMDLVGEMVISEAMVVQNPDLFGLKLDNFRKAARQLHKITGELQDIVMSIRMVPLSATFLKMHRLVRDMGKKLGKDINLELIGEETEVDKNIIEHISDPLMHLIRNSIDHGIEPSEDRQAKGKQQIGTITLEAKNAGSEVVIIVKDDGKGLNKEKILKKAKENGLLRVPEADISDKEIFNLIFLPGFSTKENVTEFSGRGVGMDVVTKNIETVGGSVSVDSIPDKGMTITLKIPLTLAIIDGMNIKVGNSCYTIPTVAIKESFRPKENDIITDPDGNEMIMVRGQCFPILRLHEYFGVKSEVTEFVKGILIMAESGEKAICIFADELLGQQQVVVKALPNYIRNSRKIEGLSGCTLLGDGSISLILDVSGLASPKKLMKIS